jgi:Sortase domain
VHTVVSAPAVAAGTALTDTVSVSGLGNQPATVTASLFGPYPSPSKMTCTGAPVSTNSIPVQADGDYTTPPTTLTTPGYYVYVESIAAVGFVKAAATHCADTAETTVVKGAPAVTTQVSDATAAPGSQISDSAMVTGLGALTATVKVQLFGPYSSPKAIDCKGAPVSTTTLAANGDGTYKSQPVTVPAAGYYTFHESIAATAAYPAVDTPCAATSETTFAQGAPQIATEVSDATVRPGSTLADHLKVTGLGKTPAKVTVDLYGPYASVSAIDCAGRPAAETSMNVAGDGSYVTPSVTIAKVGFYVFRERIDSSPTVKGVTTDCADTAETTLGSPAIITGGRGPFPHKARQASTQPAGVTPTQIQIGGLNITAPVDPITINLAKGQLGVPSDIHRTGWWRDGAAPGSHSGTVLIAGHVDSAAAGAGAFFPLPRAHKGMIVTITTQSGATFRYRVTGTQKLLKAKLPTGVWDRTGAPRLALVTCGGTFDPATGHYPDNIIVYATPV